MTTTQTFHRSLIALAATSSLGLLTQAHAEVFVQCGPNNAGVDANGMIKAAYDVDPAVAGPKNASSQCMHLAAGDGFITMADKRELYTFGFTDVTKKAVNQVPLDSLDANFSAPTIELQQGKDFYLTLTNVSMAMRPDLFDPHTVHFHGFPQQPPVFDGMPEGSFGVNMGSSFTYYYKLNDPGTYLYHCHQEATEHMQMGMLGNLYVKPLQDGTPKTYGGRTYTKFVYNDGDGSTGYDVSKPLQLVSMDSEFHDLHIGVQPLPFKNMRDDYAMINGRGYPDTVNPSPLDPPTQKVDVLTGGGVAIGDITSSQPINALITAVKGERVLLRMSNLSVTNYYTITAQGLPMKVVGSGARQLKGPDGKILYYDTSSVTLGGGESTEVMIDTSQVEPGTYFLYTTNLNFLSNGTEDNGGMMTEIVVSSI
ncbi:multicopper oxidase domain-containing protein [Hydrogenophaga sp. PAMC20947]|uniref:multicopper oxidase domain-containing protein n=1 Tax=Hydrogenophaga sp. PAMC20947 TaxID=2565558 RepID=UPI001447D86E|nr:multicopper oxidase domain-containing protein [Hydrogenophaga sp. PAMC20947]